MKIVFYLPSLTCSPLNYLWRRGWRIRCGFKLLGIHFIRYENL